MQANEIMSLVLGTECHHYLTSSCHCSSAIAGHELLCTDWSQILHQRSY